MKNGKTNKPSKEKIEKFVKTITDKYFDYKTLDKVIAKNFKGLSSKQIVDYIIKIFPNKKDRAKILGVIVFAIHKRDIRDIKHKTISKKEWKYPNYRVDNFKDALFNINGQVRENFAIIKLLKSRDIFFLCNNTYSWIAVNIPLNMCGGSVKGDIDILIAMPIFPKDFPQNQKGRMRHIYRTFEVKVSKIDKQGNCKSLKFGNKFNKTKKQLYKLIKSGSQQTFLLTIFVLESGYHNNFDKLPKLLISLIEKKVREVKNEDFGYVCTFLEQQTGWDEEKTPPMTHAPKSLKPAKIKKLDDPIKNIIKHLEKFWKENEIKDFSKIPFIAHCPKCKKLNILYAKDSSYKCKYCKKDII